jgi:co-chaperonin GroES (HSP10)
MIFKPLFDKVIVERIKPELTSAGGIVLARSEEPDRAKILAIGPDVVDVVVGEVVLLNWNAAIKVQDEMYSTKVENIIFVYED